MGKLDIFLTNELDELLNNEELALLEGGFNDSLSEVNALADCKKVENTVAGCGGTIINNNVPGCGAK